MTEEQMRKLAQIVFSMNALINPILPYYTIGNVDLGLCAYCGVIGKIRGSEIFYDHKETCTVTLCEELMQTLGVKREELPGCQ